MASFPSIPLSYASINLRERDANLHNGWEYECLLIDWMNWLSHALEWDSLERCKQIPFQIGFFVRSWVMLVNPFCVSPTLLNEIKLAVKFWQEDDLNTTGFAVCLKHTTCISNLEHYSVYKSQQSSKYKILFPWSCLKCKTTWFYRSRIFYFVYVEDLYTKRRFVTKCNA